MALSRYRLLMTQYWSEEKDKELGRRIAAARTAKGMSLAVVGEKLSVTRATVGHWETGQRAIKHADLAALCGVLDISADELLFGVQRWPFSKIDFGSVTDLEPMDLARLEGALMLTAAQLGIEIKQAAA